jgi:protein lin-28
VPSDGSEDVFVHQTAIHADGFRSLADGEDLEFEVRIDENTGKRVASNVTGPDGAYVKGAQRKPRQQFGNDSMQQ